MEIQVARVTATLASDVGAVEHLRIEFTHPALDYFVVYRRRDYQGEIEVSSLPERLSQRLRINKTGNCGRRSTNGAESAGVDRAMMDRHTDS